MPDQRSGLAPERPQSVTGQGRLIRLGIPLDHTLVRFPGFAGLSPALRDETEVIQS